MGDKSPKAKARAKKQEARMKNQKKAVTEARSPRPTTSTEPTEHKTQ
jgi:hypothetical protein